MNIETKHILALIFLVALGSAGFFATLISQRVRDVALFFLVFGAVLIQKMDVTFAGVYWYRGTSRGIEISAWDIAPLCLLIATLLLPRYERGRFYWPAGLGLMLLYCGYCTASVMRSEPQMYGVWELAKMARGLMVLLAAAIFVRTRRELGIVVFALACVAWMEALNGLEQRFFKGVFRVPGTFDHENTLSTYLCTIGPVLMAATMASWSKGLRWFCGLACLFAAGAEMLTLSRMGVPVFTLCVAATAICCTSWQITRQKLAIVAVVLIGVGGFVFVSWDGLKARYTSTNISAEFKDANAVETRGVYWRLAMLMLKEHPYGVGLNNWSYYVGKTYGPALGYAYTDYDDITWTPQKEDARQIFLAPAADSLPALMLGELGTAGMVLLVLIWLRWFQMSGSFLRGRLNPDPMHRMAIGLGFGAFGIFLQSITEWTYRQTPVMFTFHAMMGVLASLYYARRRTRRAAATANAAERADEIVVDPIPVTAARLAK